MKSSPETVFTVWCRLTGRDAAEIDRSERAAFFECPQVPELAETPYLQLLDAGISAALRGSLPLERWVAFVRAHAERELITPT